MEWAASGPFICTYLVVAELYLDTDASFSAAKVALGMVDMHGGPTLSQAGERGEAPRVSPLR